jgi:integrase
MRVKIGAKTATYRYCGTINDGTSRPFNVTIGRTDLMTLKQAQDKARHIKLQASQGEDPRRPDKPDVPTVSQALERYVDGRNLSPRTSDWYRSMVEGPLASIARRRMDELSRDECRNLHERLTRTRGAYMANGAMRTLKALYNDVARTVDLPVNPVSRAVRFNKEKRRDAAVLPEDMPLMWERLQSVENPIRRMAWLTCILTGLRVGDVTKMRWEHIDEDGVLTVPSPKGGTDRAFRLPLPKFLVNELNTFRSVSEMWSGGWVFPAKSRSGHISLLRQTPEFPYFAHQFRHGVRSYALLAGVDEAVTKLILNHKDASVTGGYLTKGVVIDAMRKGIEDISAHLLSYRN